MPKSLKKSQSGGSSNNDTTQNSGKKRRREVKVVVCPSAFPDFTTVGGSTSRRQQKERGIIPQKDAKETDDGLELDVQQTIREIHKFGATGFQGSQKKTHEKAEYEWLTGRVQKRQKIPTKILVGMRQKALKREERQKKELQESGVVSHQVVNKSSAKAKKKRNNKDDEAKAGPGLVQGVFGSNSRKNKKGNRRSMDAGSFGPAPDVGFMKKGMLRVKRPK
mmetsp:Transcript_17192/g.34370  ORF Transcript_17192/g.34370 Transcript_17192/m.34370 type:complete len:221 (+) Transcript_17192:155-817(+)|eukprot:CAMPEP_0113379814 /NCGR_PEP_ID=MMETSP0013_2-20120614/4423_1 /TAXON_ID=2843 ORGANISM="Skeletonema costatum, Strain 1716" /NCGR_SAMPLE_ID=MMETSP0013_2 /ASSEMBLY_ACC=CAM_ASM_000158 /LENGTH=220 /DNA_ID=CAMNT_0000262107 /DNA_START=67 /DNA_END=729 /DNA_ORIENTATION=- /assembly_acc=CAM_ASM_000158